MDGWRITTKLVHFSLFFTICNVITIMFVAHFVKSVSLTESYVTFPLQLLHGWQSEQSGGLPKNSSVGHTDRTDR